MNSHLHPGVYPRSKLHILLCDINFATRDKSFLPILNCLPDLFWINRQRFQNETYVILKFENLDLRYTQNSKIPSGPEMSVVCFSCSCNLLSFLLKINSNGPLAFTKLIRQPNKKGGFLSLKRLSKEKADIRDKSKCFTL